MECTYNILGYVAYYGKPKVNNPSVCINKRFIMVRLIDNETEQYHTYNYTLLAQHPFCVTSKWL